MWEGSWLSAAGGNAAAVWHGPRRRQECRSALASRPPVFQIIAMADASKPGEAAVALRFRAAGQAGTEMPRTPMLPALLGYWQSKCPGDGRLPRRAEIGRAHV